MKLRMPRGHEYTWFLPFGLVAVIVSQALIKEGVEMYPWKGLVGLLFIAGMLATLFGLLGLCHTNRNR